MTSKARLDLAKKNYTKGTTVNSASNNLKSVFVVVSSPRYGFNNTDNIYCNDGELLLYDAETLSWANIIKN